MTKSLMFLFDEIWQNMGDDRFVIKGQIDVLPGGHDSIWTQ